MTWAARYSRTEQPELTIYRDGEVVGYIDLSEPGFASDIAVRVPVTECEEPGCVNWAMPDGRCHHVHGGSDEL